MKSHITTIIRRIIQVLSFFLFPGYFVIVWNALRSVFTALIFGDFVWSSMQSSVLTLVSVIPITVLFGRFFCGYICAFGSMQDFVGFIAEKLGIKKFAFGKMSDRRLRHLKYIILALSAVIWAAEIYVADALSPWNVFGEYSSYKAWTDPSGLFSVGGLLILLIIVAAFFVSRAFCRYFCPLGGLFAILSKLRIFRIKKNTKCVGCDLCTKKCVMGIDVNAETGEYGKVVSGECISCFQCIGECAPSALYTNPQETVTGTAAALSMVGLFYIGNAIPSISGDVALSSGAYAETTELPAETSTGEPIEAPTAFEYTDGTYTGTGSGYRGTTAVNVVVSGGKITSITVESTDDDRQFMSRAKSDIIDAIIQTQGIEVKTVSGATFSSNGILEAIANALSIDFTNPNSTNPRGHGRH
jgi:polyferredoxin